jgi:hypothetical protein
MTDMFKRVVLPKKVKSQKKKTQKVDPEVEKWFSEWGFIGRGGEFKSLKGNMRQATGAEVIYKKGSHESMPNPFAGEPLISMSPYNVKDLAYETLMVSAMEANPKLGILIGLFGPRAAREINKRAGAEITRRSVRKGFEKASTDPMLKNIPFEESSIFTTKGDYSAAYNPKQGLLMESAIESPGFKTSKAFKFKEKTLYELLKQHMLAGDLSVMGSKFVFHEGRHHRQNIEGMIEQGREIQAALKSKASKGWESIDPAGFGNRLSTLIDIPKPLGKGKPTKGFFKSGGRFGITEKQRAYLSTDHEIEARIEEIHTFGKEMTRHEIWQLHSIGYTDYQIDEMLKAFKIARNKRYDGKTLLQLMRESGLF